MFDSNKPVSRRSMLRFLGATAGAVTVMTVAPIASGKVLDAVTGESALPGRSGSLVALTKKLAAAPRRREFKRVPFLVDEPGLWDHEAAMAILAYRAEPRQVWENSDIAAPWLGLMRESMNGQVFAHHHPDFFAVSATHGSAHLALFTQAMWDKYDFASRTVGIAKKNSFIIEKAGVAPSDDRHDIAGFYGAENNNITSLQRRGVVFLGCHDSIHAIARSLQAKTGTDPDVIAADLTNHMIPGVVLVPSVVAFLAEIQRAGFSYAKGS